MVMTKIIWDGEIKQLWSKSKAMMKQWPGSDRCFKEVAKTKSYTVARKLEVVEYSREANSIRSAAKKYNITTKMVRDWKLNEPQLRRTRDTVKKGRKRNLAGVGRPLLNKDFDMLLAGWVQERRALK
uniref:Brinker DNA-binding domain-containing protein n=1 Tax=Ditylenchus dipsaci TaxID=166011 RepID=A0A915DGF3_9BILA